MVESTVEISNSTALHARHAALFVQTAGKFTSHIWIIKSDKKVNAKSIMGLMSLTAVQGSQITIGAEGEDEHLAVKELTELMSLGFKE
ncbi:catabolite repression HPr-like protein/phosphocarrier protein [Anaerobacterium chartisolvens]|uniref:Catabolite repression HPr-like protein/phosphocarrier protein n=1 Tax=Anaerobacterium chartisolvens TaxID=1297424 RepID=A0A369APJ2_9FIRM|nr:HPr family phosphocarrier protein [Anaerobacterium chartisolvens]RCX11280.1 catabolite repression HPr-like protein/phosphocarrier protein [Anaerobacterium chartisolvens]